MMKRLLLCACFSAVVGCGDNMDRPRSTLDELVDDYESGATTRDEFRTEIAAMDGAALPSELTDDFTVTTLLEAREEPYRIDADLTVEAGAILVVEAGTEIILGADVNLTIAGRLYAVGSEDATIYIHAEAGEYFGEIRLQSGPNQLVWVELDRGNRLLESDHGFDTRTLVESTRFDTWKDLAVAQVNSSGLHVLRSQFGYQTDEAEVSGETVRTRGSGEIIIEECEFNYRRGYRDVLDLQDCVAGYWPIILHNRFDGGEDDGVDLDSCSALVIGNHIRNFRPEDLNVMDRGVNGGGVTGDANSRPVIVNNVIDGCYHGIGFKNGSRPIIVNNTITNSNIGVTLYQSDVNQPQPDGLMINNILWNNRNWLTDEPQEIVLNGKWWASYNQVDDIQATLDARYNITATLAMPYDGEGNTSGDPMLEFVDGIPMLTSGSPAIDSGLGVLNFADVPMDRVRAFLSRDYRGAARERDGDTFPGIDRGAVEYVGN